METRQGMCIYALCNGQYLLAEGHSKRFFVATALWTAIFKVII